MQNSPLTSLNKLTREPSPVLSSCVPAPSYSIQSVNI